MTRRIELGDLPVSRAASLTVRKSDTVEEGNGGYSLPRWKPSATVLSRWFHDTVSEVIPFTYRRIASPLPQGLKAVSSVWCGRRCGMTAESVQEGEGIACSVRFREPILAPLHGNNSEPYREHSGSISPASGDGLPIVPENVSGRFSLSSTMTRDWHRIRTLPQRRACKWFSSVENTETVERHKS